ncbi:MAG: Chitinase [Labilithrix sp.]|nr:Chitinase [Labilithrix sp.]
MRQTTDRSSLLSTLAPAFVLGLGTFLAACSPHDSAPTTSSQPQGSADVPVAGPTDPAVTARDASGQSKFMWAGRSGTTVPVKGAPADIARAQLAAHARILGISKAVVSTAILAREQRFENGGGVISFEQKVSGIPVFRTRASVVLDSTNNLVAISGNLRPAAEGHVAKFAITPEQALARAYEARFGVKLDTASIRETGVDAAGEYHAYRVTTPAALPRLVDEAKVRKVLVPQKGKLVAAYHAEFLARAPGAKTNDAWLFAIAADDGRTLVQNSLTSHEAFQYRVWAETGAKSQHGIPTDSPLTDFSPLPATATEANTKETAFAPPALVSVDGFNKNPGGAADPWLAPTATETKGNNVDAYSDRNSQDDDANTGDGFDEGVDIRANTTGTRTFDRAYDPTKQPNVTPDQVKAAITQLFYVTNWMHDYWYDSGFDEKAGNAQASNYGRGGKEGDPLLAEAQDGADVGLANNANMSSRSDGTSPRMQMYVWNGLPTASLTTSPAVAITDRPGSAEFGPQVFNVTGALAVATPTNGCTVPTGVTGKIAIIDRGVCAFSVKAANAQAGGATGVLLVNNAPGHIAISPAGVDATITIPALGLSLEDGALLKAAVAAGTVNATMKRSEEILRDGTIDNTIVAHEWGHYLHHRLVDCGSASCSGMSEGWADFNALMMVIKEADVLDGTVFPLSQYAGVSPYFGIRRAPYSSDLGKNPFTFKSIRKDYVLPTNVPLNPVGGSNAEAHNAGEIWAETLFEAYTNLLRDTKGATPRLTFDQAKRRMADYIVAGMKATPAEPTFAEQRDAVLAVAFAADPKDFLALSKGFAKRGLGVGAIAPPVESTDFLETQEDYSTKGNLDFVDAKIDDAVRSCDRDGFLDADEKGDATIRVRNGGWENLANTTVTVTTTAPGVTFGNGGKGTALSIDPFGIVKVRIPVSLDPTAAKQQFVPIKITLANAGSLKATVDGTIEPRSNFDIKESSATTDDVESPKPVWTLAHGLEDTPTAWARELKTDADGADLSPPDYHWVGADLGARADESLVSPALTVSATDAFTISFKHKYAFEFGPSGAGKPSVAFDGAVIEISEDNGATWKDVTTYGGAPGYTQTIYTNDPDPTSPDNNPLAGRLGYGGTLDTLTPVSIDLGNSLAGKTVKVRFRIGSDPASGETGWEIDDIGFAGITNQPFATLVDDASVCKGVPVPVPGAPQTVPSGTKVTLDASGSSDPDGDAITFAWEQLDGSPVKLDDPSTQAKTGFTAPVVTAETKLLFRVTVADAKQAASDTVEITVIPAVDAGTPTGDGGATGDPGGPASPSDDSCSCRTVGAQQNAGFGAIGTMLAGVLALVLRGRRKK